MTEPLRFNLDIGDARSASLDGLFYAAANLSRHQRYVVSIREWHPPLQRNYMARIHIPIREIAEFSGHTELEVKKFVKKKFYPRELRLKGKKLKSVPKHTQDLTPKEARAVEIGIIGLAQDMGCPLSSPQSRGVRV